MKKNLFYLFALICSMGLFTACSEDDDKSFPTDEVNMTFTSTDASNQLALTYSGEPMLGKSVAFNTTDGKTATIVLSGADLSLTRSTATPGLTNPSVIPGETSTTLNVTLVPVGETGYTFEGKDDANNRTIEYKGAVEKGKLTLSLNVKMTNDLIGTWNLYPYDPYDEDYIFPIRTIWESKKPFLLDVFGMGEVSEMPPSGLLMMMGALEMIEGKSLNGAISALLKDVTFRADGNIEATYSDAANLSNPVWAKSPLNIAQYYVRDNKVYLLLNVDAIIGSIATASASTRMDISTILPQLLEFLPMLSTGIPLGYTKGENGALGVYVDMELGVKLLNAVVPILQNEEILAAIIESAKSNPVFAPFAGLTEELIKQLPGVVQGTTKMELGLNLVKAN